MGKAPNFIAAKYSWFTVWIFGTGVYLPVDLVVSQRLVQSRSETKIWTLSVSSSVCLSVSCLTAPVYRTLGRVCRSRSGVKGQGQTSCFKVKVRVQGQGQVCWTLRTQLVQSVVQHSPLRPLVLAFGGEPSIWTSVIFPTERRMLDHRLDGVHKVQHIMLQGQRSKVKFLQCSSRY